MEDRDEQYFFGHLPSLASAMNDWGIFMKRYGVVAAIALMTAGCQTDSVAATGAAIGLDYSWSGISACTAKPPAFHLSNVPADTKKLRFKLTDLDVPSYFHGGGDVAYSGSGEIPAGAFSYTGPCPPVGMTHNYDFSVIAFNAAGAVVGRGEATRPFPPK